MEDLLSRLEKASKEDLSAGEGEWEVIPEPAPLPPHPSSVDVATPEAFLSHLDREAQYNRSNVSRETSPPKGEHHHGLESDHLQIRQDEQSPDQGQGQTLPHGGVHLQTSREVLPRQDRQQVDRHESVVNQGATSVALAIPEPPDAFALTLLTPDQLFKGTPSETISTLISEHDLLAARINEVAAIANGKQFADVMDHFICGNSDPDSRSHSRILAAHLFQLEGALSSLSASMWKRAMQLTDVYDSMPQDRRSAWDESIQKMTTPPFTDSNVHATLGDLLSKRIQFLSERVDGIFRNLSLEHLTNCPQGFNKRMIIGYIHQGSYPDSRRTGFVSDLRHVIAKFMGRELPHYTSSHELIRACMRNWGQWMDVDGGAMRIRVYKKGTAHIEIHPEMAWRLNAILSHMHPRAIAAEHKRRPTVRDRTWKVMQQPLPYEVLHLIAELKSYRDNRRERVMPYYSDNDSLKPDKRVMESAIQVMQSLGAVFDGRTFTFEFDPTDVLDLLECSGCIPDHVSHQYFPTPRMLGEFVISLADIHEGHTVGEFSAGQGHLAELSPVKPLCVEISKLHCEILKAKGFEVVEGDFLAWARLNPLRRFDRVVMNPPFRDGQHHAHLIAACSLLSEQGRLVCILPGGEKEQTLQRARKALPGYEVRWERVPEEVLEGGRFPGTSIKVGVVVVERVREG